MEEVRLTGPLRERVEEAQRVKAEKSRVYLGFNEDLVSLEHAFSLGDWRERRFAMIN